MGAKPLAMNRRQMVDECYAAHQDTIGNSCLSHKPGFRTGNVSLRYFRADFIRGDDVAPIQRAILPSSPDAQPLRPLGEN